MVLQFPVHRRLEAIVKRWLGVVCMLAACATGKTTDEPCDEGGARSCDGEITLMCLCEGDDPFIEDCPSGGLWKAQDTLCASCQDWLDDSCPVE